MIINRPRIFLPALVLILACFGPVLAAEGKTAFKFAFNQGKVAGGYTQVPPTTAYTKELGYGFDLGTVPTAVDRGGDDALHGGFVTSDRPFYFSVAVPEGNYNITVTLGDSAGESSTALKAESRRLLLEKVTTAAGQFVTRTVTINVHNARVPPPPLNAPGNDHVELNDRENGPRGLVPDWDEKLTLEFNGARPCVCAVVIEKVECPTVFLAGDSTVTDQPSEPGASWGQMLPRFLKPGIAVANHAESGETLKSFITELRLDKILSQMKAGDYLFVQFGHNDSKVQWPQTYVEAGTTYRAYLKVFIAEARRRGATPVLVSSMQRRQFDANGKVRNSHGDYPAAVRQVAQEEGVAFIDLTAMSVAFYEALGPEKSARAFNDQTHHNNYGAYELAKCIVQGIRDDQLGLAQFIVDDFAGFDPARPDPVESFAVPASPGRMTLAPRGN